MIPPQGWGAGDVLFPVMLTIGQQLKQAREEKRLTLEDVFKGTRIRIPYLQALEADDLTLMPSPVQARGYLRNYAEFLGLNFDRLLEDMREQAQSAPMGGMITPMDLTPAPEPDSSERSDAELRRQRLSRSRNPPAAKRRTPSLCRGLRQP